ncbi:MFS transporter [Catenovulum sp. SM1970]|uniref:MFS transporter n=1 Tax=Marinifaba aquimaris TaxID=2741323 RepID=UPI001572760A|nr:MFS transporter [Marinifaba aquimaris]NTS77176.1 MFS transporter [Marinifaba aquimaris]
MSKVFLIFAIGQIVIAFGSAITAFSMSVWIYQHTNSVAMYTMGMVFFTLPGAILSPFLGVLIDKYDPRKVALIADSALAACISILLALYSFDRLAIEVIFAMGIIFSIAGVLKFASLATVVPMLVSQDNLAKANGLLSMGTALTQTIAPLLAGMLLLMIGLNGIFVFNLFTFMLGSLSFIFLFKHSIAQQQGQKEAPDFTLSEAFKIFDYFKAHTNQTRFVIYLALQNFVISLVAILTLPLIMAMYTEYELGLVMTITSFGALVGGGLIFMFPPKSFIRSILICNLILGALVAVLGCTQWLPLIMACGFLIALFGPFIDSCEKSYWQIKIPKKILGRFFSFRAAIESCTFPIAAVVSGVLVDQVFAPAMRENGSLVPIFGDLVGVGEGRGIGVLFLLAGVIYALVALLILVFNRNKLAASSAPQLDKLPEEKVVSE